MGTSIGRRWVSGSLVFCLSIAQCSSLIAAQVRRVNPSDNAHTLRALLDSDCLHYGDLSLRDEYCKDLTLRAANLGDPKAMAEVGWRYLVRDTEGASFRFRVGLVPSNETAYSWISKAADAGSRDAMVYLGWMYQRGQGVERDLAHAQTWLRRGAEAGATRAMAMLGVMQLFGEGTAGSEAEGERWLRRAADGGDRRAMTILALLLLKRGATTGQSGTDKEPVVWLNKACAGDDNWLGRTTVGIAGDPLACYHLGVLYAAGGAGLPQNRERAGVAFYNVNWLARTSDSDSRDWYELGNGITPEIRRAAEKGRQEFRPDLDGGSGTEMNVWKLLIGVTAALMVGQAILGGGASASPSRDDQREEERKQLADREWACIMSGGTWMSLAHVCHF
jgi:TPR repeat protein